MRPAFVQLPQEDIAILVARAASGDHSARDRLIVEYATRYVRDRAPADFAALKTWLTPILKDWIAARVCDPAYRQALLASTFDVLSRDCGSLFSPQANLVRGATSVCRARMVDDEEVLLQDDSKPEKVRGEAWARLATNLVNLLRHDPHDSETRARLRRLMQPSLSGWLASRIPPGPEIENLLTSTWAALDAELPRFPTPISTGRQCIIAVCTRQVPCERLVEWLRGMRAGATARPGRDIGWEHSLTLQTLYDRHHGIVNGSTAKTFYSIDGTLKEALYTQAFTNAVLHFSAENGSFKGYLHCTFRNVLCDEIRRQDAERRNLGSRTSLDEPGGDDGRPLHDFLRDESQSSGLADLSGEFRGRTLLLAASMHHRLLGTLLWLLEYGRSEPRSPDILDIPVCKLIALIGDRFANTWGAPQTMVDRASAILERRAREEGVLYDPLAAVAHQPRGALTDPNARIREKANHVLDSAKNRAQSAFICEVTRSDDDAWLECAEAYEKELHSQGNAFCPDAAPDTTAESPDSDTDDGEKTEARS